MMKKVFVVLVVEACWRLLLAIIDGGGDEKLRGQSWLVGTSA